MGLFRGAVFRRGGVPENCPLVLMGRFPSLMGRFPTLMGRCPECLNEPFSFFKIPWKTAHKERGIKGFLNLSLCMLVGCKQSLMTFDSLCLRSLR